MWRWMGSHFHDWTDYNGVAFSIELLEWGRTFSNFWVGQFFIFTVSKRTRMFVLSVKSEVFFIQYSVDTWIESDFESRKLHISPKVTKVGSIIGHRTDYNGVRALRGQRHIPSKINPSTPSPPGNVPGEVHVKLHAPPIMSTSGRRITLLATDRKWTLVYILHNRLLLTPKRSK